jgi:hypothetical protein
MKFYKLGHYGIGRKDSVARVFVPGFFIKQLHLVFVKFCEMSNYCIQKPGSQNKVV